MYRVSSRGNPWHDKLGRFCHGPKGEVDTWGNPISNEQRQEAVIKSEKQPNEYKLRSESRKSKILQNRNDEKQLIKTYYNSSEEDFKKQSEVFISKYGKKEFEKVKKRAEVINGKKNINKEVNEAINNKTTMPFYDNEEKTALKHKILKEKFGDTKEQAKERTKERFNVEKNGKNIYCQNAEKKIDGNGNIYYEATNLDTGYQILITKDEYKNRKVHRINGLKVVGEKYNIGTGEYYTEEEMNKIVKDSPYADLSQYTKHKGVLHYYETENGNLYSVRDGMIPTETEIMPWQSDPMYRNQKNAKLIWLNNHPNHKYNDTSLNWKIKRIQTMSDNNVPIEMRRKAFEKMMIDHNLNENEAIGLLGKEFLK